ncbi:hypothetical protein KSF78_0006743 [Schistosoma japonicum]|nr:hypothetical protein KSF78_0006743 [Schistosoma japonicum]
MSIGSYIFQYVALNLAILFSESSLHSQQQSLSRQQKFVKDSDISDLVNITQCIELKDSNLNLNSQLSETMNSSSEEFHLPPLNRITVISQDDLHQLCALLEFRGYFLITFTNNDTNERVCYRIPIDLKEEYSSNDDISYIMEKSLYMNTNYTINSIIHNSGNTMNSNDDNSNKSKIPYIEPDNLKIITTNSSCCDNFLRCFTLSFDSNKHVNDLLKDWTIDFYWNRTPEMYEFGEDGWSSVGTPVGALSGVYDLVDVKLKYRFGKNFGLDFSNAENGMFVADTFIFF